MRIEVSRYSGFCAGVRAAVEKAFAAAEQSKPCWALGSLIHNEQVMDRLRTAGVRVASSAEEIDEGTVIIRSHGASPQTIEALRSKGLTLVDATCPNVARVHRIVARYSAQGGTVFIAGQRNHPEVCATAGWCKGPVYVLEDAQAAERIEGVEHALLVAQTTLTPTAWTEIVQVLKEKIPYLEMECTICRATENRQREAARVSELADIVLVVGDRNSANTRALYDTCALRCKRTYFIGSAAELQKIQVHASDYIVITAGASTPDWSLKEVATRMNDLEQKVPQNTVEPSQAEPAEDSFEAQIEATLVTIRPGQTVTGKVIQITDDEIGVAIGYKADGLIKIEDLVDKDVKMDDEIEAEVVKVNDGEGNVLLSQKNIINRRNWDELMVKYENNEYIDAVGKEAVKGGLIADVNGVRAFVPASQLARHFVEKIDEFVGKEMKLKIIEADKQKKRIVCSRKQVLVEESAARKQEVWGKLQEGEIVTGIVRRLTDFGAFVDLGGVDGLVHVTDLSWGRVKHPSEVVAPNQEIQVKILSLDPERERIQLSYKQTQPHPWAVAEEKYPVGSIVEGKVARVATFGAFVELEPGLDGLVHISQCALSRIAKVEDAVQEGQTVRVKVLAVDPEAKRISLSIRKALEEEAFTPGEELALDELPGDEA